MGLDVTVLGAFTAGLLSFLSPCVLPLVPPYLSFLAGVGLNELREGAANVAPPRRVVLLAVCFVLGFATVFVLLGAGASAAGQVVARHLDLLGTLAGILIIVLGLHMMGLRIPILFREARFHPAAKPAGPVGAYVIGLAFAFGWTPCVGPVLAAVLLLAGSGDTVGEGAWLLVAYSAGIGVPFVLAAAFIGPFLRAAQRFRRYVGVVEKVSGGLLVATGLLFVTGQMPVIGGWLLETAPVLGRIG